MSDAVPGVAFAAFCVWLTVRIVNRRERWAKRMAVGMILTTVLYIASWGPLQTVGFSVFPNYPDNTPESVLTFFRIYGWPQRMVVFRLPASARDAWFNYLDWWKPSRQPASNSHS